MFSLTPACNRRAILAAVALAVVMPWAVPGHVDRALAALHLSGPVAVVLLAAAILGHAVRVRIWPVADRPGPSSRYLEPPPSGECAVSRAVGTGIAVSVGGCLVPGGLAAYETAALTQQGVSLLPPAAAVVITTAVCYALTRPADGAGIPADVAAFVAACSALVLAPDHAVPVGVAAGALGPLLGAELLHLHHARQRGPGAVSLGDTSTFDGILLSCLVAMWLA